MKKPNFYDYLNFFLSRLSILRLQRNDILLYLNILKISNKLNCKNPVEIGTNILCGCTGMSNVGIVRSRENLEKAGLIKFIPGIRRTTLPVYTILLPDDLSSFRLDQMEDYDVADETITTENVTNGVTNSVTNGVTKNTENVTNGVTNSVTNSVTNGVTKTRFSHCNIEIKNKNLTVNSKADAAENSKFFSEFFSEKNRSNVEQFAMSIHSSPDEVRVLAETVVAEWGLTGLAHLDYQDWARHLMNTIRIKRFKQGATAYAEPNNHNPQNSDNNDTPNQRLTAETLERMPLHELIAKYGPDAQYEFGRAYILEHPELFGE